MAKISERTHLMKENFMALHNVGFSIPDIAKKYELSYSTVYRCLQEIADANHVSRTSLLQIVRIQSSERFLKEEEHRVRVDVEALNHGFAETGNAIQSIIKNIDKILEDHNNDN